MYFYLYFSFFIINIVSIQIRALILNRKIVIFYLSIYIFIEAELKNWCW